MPLSDNIHSHILKYKGFLDKSKHKLSTKWRNLAIEYVIPFITARFDSVCKLNKE